MTCTRSPRDGSSGTDAAHSVRRSWPRLKRRCTSRWRSEPELAALRRWGETSLQYPRTSMRLSPALACLLLMVGCVGPHSTGALWAQQNLEQELILGRQTEAERLAKLHAYELVLS